MLATNYLKTANRARAVGAGQGLEANFPAFLRSGRSGSRCCLSKRSAFPEAIDVLERARLTGPPSYELALNLGSAYVLQQGSRQGARHLRPGADAEAGLDSGAAPGRRRSRNSRASSNGRSPTGCARGRSSRTIRRFCSDSAASASRWICWRTPSPRLIEAASLKPDEPSYQYTLAAAKVGKRQFEAAQGLLEPLVSSGPSDPQLQYALGSVFYIQGRLDRCSGAPAGERRGCSRSSSRRTTISRWLREIRATTQRPSRCWKRLLQRYPDHAPSCEALGSLLMSAQRYDEAEAQPAECGASQPQVA